MLFPFPANLAVSIFLFIVLHISNRNNDTTKRFISIQYVLRVSFFKPHTLKDLCHRQEMTVRLSELDSFISQCTYVRLQNR